MVLPCVSGIVRLKTAEPPSRPSAALSEPSSVTIISGVTLLKFSSSSVLSVLNSGATASNRFASLILIVGRLLGSKTRAPPSWAWIGNVTASVPASAGGWNSWPTTLPTSSARVTSTSGVASGVGSVKVKVAEALSAMSPLSIPARRNPAFRPKLTPPGVAMAPRRIRRSSSKKNNRAGSSPAPKSTPNPKFGISSVTLRSTVAAASRLIPRLVTSVPRSIGKLLTTVWLIVGWNTSFFALALSTRPPKPCSFWMMSGIVGTGVVSK